MFPALKLVAVAAALFGVVPFDENRSPAPWRALTPSESQTFDLGHAVFNTQFTAANEPPGLRDGIGPLFNAPSCDACHNSRRRGRGPNEAGTAPIELVMQLGTRAADGTVRRGSERFGFVINTAANGGLQPEATVTIRYEEVARLLPDGSRASLRKPTYDVVPTDGKALSGATVLMPRMPQSIQGVGLLARVRADEIASLTKVSGGRVPDGRFGWQATEPTVASQVAAAFSREMGLTTPLIAQIDCPQRCDGAASGGTPEVDAKLFDAVVRFTELHAVPRTTEAAAHTSQSGSRLFVDAGCAACHREKLSLEPVSGDEHERVIQPYTDLLLHDLGSELADRDVAGNVVPTVWRTAPLWGLNAAVATGRPSRLLHDGRARGIEEAILWHGGAASAARLRFENLPKRDRDAIVEWISAL